MALAPSFVNQFSIFFRILKLKFEAEYPYAPIDTLTIEIHPLFAIL